MDEFTSRVEELNTKFAVRNVSASQQNLALQAETCNGCALTPLFMAGLNGSFTGAMIPTSSSSSQLVKESPLMEEVLLVARGQRQIMHQLDNLSNLLHEYRPERSLEERTDVTSRTTDVESIAFFCSGLSHLKNDFLARNPILQHTGILFIAVVVIMIGATPLTISCNATV
ncbi:hypothetical protein CsSME_00053894 [Camellia sinensis var. sinensis]